MYDILEKIFAVILIVILMFFFPLLDSFERMDDLSYMTVYAATVKFVDAVRNTGKITPQMYFEFKQLIDATGNTYNVEILHRQLAAYPETDTSTNTSYGYLELYDEFYTHQILCQMGVMEVKNNELVYSNKETNQMKDYDNFQYGDYFYVCVTNVNRTAATVIKETLYGMNIEDLSIIVPYGGMIRNEIIE